MLAMIKVSMGLIVTAVLCVLLLRRTEEEKALQRSLKELECDAVADKEHQQATASVDTGQEYDFLGSDEGVSAKIDLARAYLDMEDYASAEQMLRDVMIKGDQTQCAQAERLLDQLPS